MTRDGKTGNGRCEERKPFLGMPCVRVGAALIVSDVATLDMGRCKDWNIPEFKALGPVEPGPCSLQVPPSCWC